MSFDEVPFSRLDCDTCGTVICGWVDESDLEGSYFYCSIDCARKGRLQRTERRKQQELEYAKREANTQGGSGSPQERRTFSKESV